MTENQLRALVRAYQNQGAMQVLWFEAAPGSTPGVPDCFIVNAGRGGVWLELKVGTMNDDGTLSYKLRARQQAVHDVMRKYSVCVMILVGDKNGDRLWLARDKTNYMSTSSDKLFKHLRTIAYGEMLNVLP